MSRLVLLIPLFFAIFWRPMNASEELIAHVNAQKKLTPIYFAPISSEGSGFDKAYVTRLEKVLRFDFEHNGMTELAQTSKGWTQLDVKIAQKKLQLKLRILPEGKIKGLDNISLTGDLAQDRRILHQVHDTIHETLFGIPGIANTHILYTLRIKEGDNATHWKNEVWQADYDGANAKQMTHDHCLCVTPAYIPAKIGSHSHHFLYVSYKIGQPKIYTGTIDGKPSQRLSLLKGNQLMPAISPQLDQIAFISDVTGNPDLFVQNFSTAHGLTGKPRQIFCAPGGAQGTPTFHPDGKKIAFVSNKDGTPRIYVLDIPPEGASIKTIKPKLISKKTKENTSPAWSPDGKKIAYSAQVAGKREIWIYDVETGEETQLTEGIGEKENPVWASNSTHLIFNATNRGESNLYMINLNQQKAVKITQGVGEKRFPSWETVAQQKN